LLGDQPAFAQRAIALELRLEIFRLHPRALELGLGHPQLGPSLVAPLRELAVVEPSQDRAGFDGISQGHLDAGDTS
jgi:hypothetical protein